MIKVLTAFTHEMDDLEQAVAEIHAQLDLEHNALANSVGIITCYAEFIETGVVEALQKSLPFSTVGTTSLASAAEGAYGQLLLTLSVLTSDDVRFATAVSTSLTDTQEAPLKAAYDGALAALGGKPSLMIGYMALMQNVGGDTILAALEKASGDLPVFGTVTVDHTPDYHSAYILHDGKPYRDAFSFVLLGGDVQPSFMVASISPEKIRKQAAIITASEGNVVKEVNGRPLLEYLQSLGLAQDGRIEGVNAIPFVIDYNDGTEPVARAFFALTPEGHAVCGGAMPVNTTLSVGAIDYEDVIATTGGMMEKMLQKQGLHGTLMYSCISRNIALGVETEAEMQRVSEKLGGALPYQFCYSGGEICPVTGPDGRLINRFHNDTIVACIL